MEKAKAQEESGRSGHGTYAMPWRYLLLFCSYGFLMYFKPASPYLVDFLNEEKGFSTEQIYEDIFPVWTYGQLFFMLLFGVAVEFVPYVGYRGIISFGALAYLSESLFFLFCSSLALMQVCELAVAAGVASIQIFSAYSYTVVDHEYYQRVTSYTRTSFLLGTVSSSLLGQFLVLFTSVEYSTLYYLHLGTSAVALVLTFFFPVGKIPPPTIFSPDSYTKLPDCLAVEG
eukprot:CAMPEP_0119119420 /NCGR_PEP_ID=MMETSP1310-20130426/922_1 /TAXON_ID=464262 /ORGANISM="Genus nov. species nov., Strain RCC2339" /LENGTH=228 /DNA_ID=CAMNT_0007108859 /DNA_START=161 /DNA_END=843 /DNA_ORIENTATION=+